MKIRQTTKADILELLVLHREAVQRTAAAFYTPDILEEWSPGTTAERIDRMGQNLDSNEVISLVAEIDGVIAGFGELLPDKSVLGAIYVHPDYGRNGVGGQLMAAIEKLAIDLGVKSLEMDASLNAEAFYSRHGFEVIERGEHVLRTGLKMPCVKMRKSLSP